MAEQLKVAGNVWNNLSEDEQERITRIVGSTGLVKGGFEIVPDPSVELPEGFLGIDFCEIGCSLAQAAATAACAALSGPAAAVCIAVATAGGNFCREQC